MTSASLNSAPAIVTAETCLPNESNELMLKINLEQQVIAKDNYFNIHLRTR